MVEKFNTLHDLFQIYPQDDLGKAEDLTKIKPVNNLIPICRVYVTNKKPRPYWACQCKICKKYKITIAPQIKDPKSPGCCGNVKNLIGKRFGRLIVLQQSEKRRDRNVFWICKCDCGNICQICSSELLKGDTQSCGCLVRENSSHGELKITQLLKQANIPFITRLVLLSSFLAIRLTLAPNWLNVIQVCLPSPDDAPVTIICFPVKSIGLIMAYLSFRIIIIGFNNW